MKFTFRRTRKLLAVLLAVVCMFPADQLLAASSGSFQVLSGGLVASERDNTTSSSFQVQSRNSVEQVYGTSSGFQIYSSFSADVPTDFVLSTITPVNGDVTSLGLLFLNDDVSQLATRDIKINYTNEVPQFGDHIPFFAALTDADTLAVTERLLNFDLITIGEPIVFLPVDRVSSDSRKISVSIPQGLTMDSIPSFMGPVIELPLPDIENFDERYAIDLPTNVPINFDGNIDVCMFGTPASTSVPLADDVEVFFSNDGLTWAEDASAVNKFYEDSTEQFCFQTDHLTSFVIGSITEPVIPPTPPVVTPTPSRGGGSGGGGGSIIYNPQSVIDGVATTDKTYRTVQAGQYLTKEDDSQEGTDPFYASAPEIENSEPTEVPTGIPVFEEDSVDDPAELEEQAETPSLLELSQAVVPNELSDLSLTELDLALLPPEEALLQQVEYDWQVFDLIIDEEVVDIENTTYSWLEALSRRLTFFHTDQLNQDFIAPFDSLYIVTEAGEDLRPSVLQKQEDSEFFWSSAPECNCKYYVDDDYLGLRGALIFWLFILVFLFGMLVEHSRKEYFETQKKPRKKKK